MYSEDELSARVAWAYYQEELTQAEIAERMQLTRARVNRILQQCKQSGIVRISIDVGAACARLEHALENRWGLTRAVVVPTPAKERKVNQVIGKQAGEYLSTILRSNQTVGLGWGTTMRWAWRGVSPVELEGLTLISLFGGLPNSSTTTPYDVAATMARKLSSSACYYIAAPMYVTSEEVRETLMTQPMFADIFARAGDVDVALIGTGDLSTKSTNLKLGAVSQEEWMDLREHGAVGELFGYFLDAEGRPVDHSLNRRFMGAKLEKLKTIPTKIVAAGGQHKLPILKAALGGGYTDVLVTDEQTAAGLVTGGQAG